MTKKILLFSFLQALLWVNAQENQSEKESERHETLDTLSEETPKRVGLLHQKTLTGDWGGLRTKMKKDWGITVKSSITQFYQGMTVGEGNDDFEYGSKLGLTTIVNGEKLGLWKGFFTIIRAEYNIGHSVDDSRGGVVLPPNLALRYPGMEGADRFDANIYFIQFLSKTDKLIFGKLNNIDMSNPVMFKGGSGLTGFMNNSFASSPNGIAVPTVLGAYYLSQKKSRNITLAVYDANSRTNKMGFDGAFSDGVTFVANFDIPSHFLGKEGHHGIMSSYSSKEVTNTRDLKEFLLTGVEDKNTHRWLIGYYFNQTFFHSETNQKQKYGLFGQVILNDGKGTPFDYSWLIGIGGSSPIVSRPLDKFGIGYYHYSFNSGVSNLAIPNFGTTSDNESGAELYYDAYLTPWFAIGANLQWVSPGIKTLPSGYTNNDVLFFGMRSIIKL